MVIFGRKKRREIEEVKAAIEKPPEVPKKPPELPEKPPKAVKVERPPAAPLFIKLDRYRAILNTLAYLKSTMAMIRDGFATLNELEKLRGESLSLIQETMARIEEYLLALDTEFVRPVGFKEELPEVARAEGLEATLANLRYQLDRLRAELERLK